MGFLNLVFVGLSLVSIDWVKYGFRFGWVMARLWVFWVRDLLSLVSGDFVGFGFRFGWVMARLWVF